MSIPGPPRPVLQSPRGPALCGKTPAPQRARRISGLEAGPTRAGPGPTLHLLFWQKSGIDQVACH